MKTIIDADPKENAAPALETQERHEVNGYAEAMEIIIAELRKDQGSPDSMYFCWQSNIAGIVRDNSNLDRDAANKIATEFLDLLMV